MRRLSPVKVALAGVFVAALTVGGAYAASPPVDDGDMATDVNKNGHEVDEHAADGQARAAAARAAAAARKAAKAAVSEKPIRPAKADQAEKASRVTATEKVTEPKEDNGNHGGPNEAAGDHPNENAFLNPQDHEPQGPKDDHSNNAGGLGPNEHAGDHPNDHATEPQGDRGKGGKQ